VSAYEPPLGKPAGGYPIGTLHTGDDERATTESALRDAVSKELGDQADQADLVGTALTAFTAKGGGT
jgi:hypothetical protein